LPFRFDEDARFALRNNDRKAALNFLRKKKRTEKDIADKDIQYQRLLSKIHFHVQRILMAYTSCFKGMVEQLAQTKQTKEIVEIYKAGSKAFKVFCLFCWDHAL
jgi:hypothetical protein